MKIYFLDSISQKLFYQSFDYIFHILLKKVFYLKFEFFNLVLIIILSNNFIFIIFKYCIKLFANFINCNIKIFYIFYYNLCISINYFDIINSFEDYI